MLHSLFVTWFHLSREWGYAGVFLLMAIESTVFPIPSEVVVPPAAYWAQQGEMSFWGVVLASTLGSWADSNMDPTGLVTLLHLKWCFTIEPRCTDTFFIWVIYYRNFH